MLLFIFHANSRLFKLAYHEQNLDGKIELHQSTNREALTSAFLLAYSEPPNAIILLRGETHLQIATRVLGIIIALRRAYIKFNLFVVGTKQ